MLPFSNESAVRQIPIQYGNLFQCKICKRNEPINPTLQQFFMRHGYRVASGGKVFMVILVTTEIHCLKSPRPTAASGKGPIRRGIHLLTATRSMYLMRRWEYKVAQWANEQWKTVTEKPLFMSVGFYRPHRPLQVPNLGSSSFGWNNQTAGRARRKR